MTHSTPKRVLITGVTGQDGSYMADLLLATTPHLIYGMLRRTAKPDLSNLKGALANPRFKTVVGDLADSQSIDNVVKEVKPDYFINLASQSFVGSSWTLPEQTFDVGAVGLIRVLEAVRKHAPKCRVYSAGSSESWGDVAYTPQDEKHPMRPRSPYGAAKCAAALIAKVWRESYGLYVVHATLLNHESERRGEEFVTRKITLGVARIYHALKFGRPFEPIELGNLDAKRDWSHAQDFVEGMWLMLNQEYHEHEGVPAIDGSPEWWDRHEKERREARANWQPSEYVLASNETHSVREFVQLAFAEAGIVGEWVQSDHKDPRTEQFVMPVAKGQHFHYQIYRAPLPLVRINPVFYRPAEVDLLHGDSTRARRELGWSPKVSFPTLVKRMVAHDLATFQPSTPPTTPIT